MNRDDAYKLMVGIICAVAVLTAIVCGAISTIEPTLISVTNANGSAVPISLPIFATGFLVLVFSSGLFIATSRWKFKFWWMGIFFSLVVIPILIAFILGIVNLVLITFGFSTDYIVDTAHFIALYLFVAMISFAAVTSSDSEEEVVKSRKTKK